MFRKIFILFLLPSLPLSGLGPGEAGYNFLKIPQGVRSSLFNYANAALAGDLTQVFWNPATIYPTKTLNFTVMNYVAGIKTGGIAYTLKPDWIVNASYLNSGTIEKMDETEASLGNFSTNHMSIAVTHSKKTKENLTIGGGGKLLYQGIPPYTSFAAAVDLGVIFTPRLPGIQLAAALRNLGYELKPFIKERFLLPTELILGASYKNPGLALGIGTAIATDYLFALSLGMTIKISNLLTLGVGYNSKGNDLKTQEFAGILNGFAFGLFLTRTPVEIGYSYTPFGELGALHRIGVEWKLR